MRTVLVLLIVGVVVAAPAPSFGDAQQPQTSPPLCVEVDVPHDTLSPRDRAAAVQFLLRRFEAEGWRTVEGACGNQYLVSHVRLGNTIFVSLAGAAGHRDGMALGLDDLPAIYSQMVRSLVTGEPMTDFHVIDRTNVTAYQATRPSVPAHTFAYARVGPGLLFAGSTHATPAGGFGYRAELDAFAIDFSFLNVQAGGTSPARDTASTTSWIRLEALRFLKPSSNSTPYWGAGLGLGGTYVSSGSSSWSGNGLRGELTAGYELPRASTLRVFVQADAVLPFYFIRGQSYSYGQNYQMLRSTPGQRYAPSITLTVGMGWHQR